jgi:CHAT domain-containing protein/tetratricopeptide (TPR) repeat protein
MAEADPVYREVLRLAQQQDHRRYQGWARIGIGAVHTHRGELAEARLEQEQAISLFRELGLEFDEVWALNELGNTLSHLGEIDGARECYLRTVEVARTISDSMLEAWGLNNLGTLEFAVGDPGVAERYFHRAYELHLGRGERRDALVPASNVAYCKIVLGQFEDAVAILEEALRMCREDGYQDTEVTLLMRLGDVYAAMGSHHQAAALYRSALARADRVGLKKQVDGLVGLATSLPKIDSSRVALALLEEHVGSLLNHVPPGQFLRVELTLADLLQQAGDHESAVDILRRVEAQAIEYRIPEHRMAAPLLAAPSYRGLGRRDSALACLRRAADVWEEVRGMPMDREWREQRGEGARRLYTQLADLSLSDGSDGNSPERTRETFVELQQFKARTLLEWAKGPGRPMTSETDGSVPPGFDMDHFQMHTLGADDLFLDAYLGAEKSFLFAVTQDGCLVSELPGVDELSPKLHVYRDLLAMPPHSGSVEQQRSACTAAARHLGELLLGDLREEIRRSRRILLAADGPLNLIPVGTLVVPAAPGLEPDLMLAHCEVVQVPSASFLVQLHRREETRLQPSENSRMLALGVAESEGGEHLAGALREVRLLGRRYRGFEVWDSSRYAASRFTPDTMSDYDLIHVAAHTAIDDQHPWRSGILLTRDDGTGVARYMRASQISSSDFDTKLVILSGCESAGGRIRSGEGVVGLTNSFLTAGVPAVVATLWPVDDRVTVRFIEHLYHGLENGKPVGVALQDAQLEIRGRAETNHPFYWAGFVAIGDGGMTVVLQRRDGWGRAGLAAVALLALIAVAAAARWLTRRRAVQAAEDSRDFL